jgi:phage regulator Rha-like protein
MNGLAENNCTHIDSREVAELLGKPHTSLVKAIGKNIKYLNDGNIPADSFFIESSYEDGAGRVMPCYLLTKIGCTMMANKLNGRKALLFVAACAKRFDELESVNTEISISVALTVNGYTPPEEQVHDGNGGSGNPNLNSWHSVTEIARKCGVYSIYGNPHIQAIACILNEFIHLDDEHKRTKLVESEGRTGKMAVYDNYALSEVLQWLIDNECPDEIYGYDRTFYANYVLA